MEINANQFNFRIRQWSGSYIDCDGEDNKRVFEMSEGVLLSFSLRPPPPTCLLLLSVLAEFVPISFLEKPPTACVFLSCD